MKRPFIQYLLKIILLLIPLVPGPSVKAGVVIFSEDFENPPSASTYTISGAFSDGLDDYFTYVSQNNAPTGLPAYNGISGTGFWAMEDVDAPENESGVAALLFSDILIEETIEVTFALKAAAGDTHVFDGLDDYLHVEYRLNGGLWQSALAFQNDGTAFNSALLQDSDFDGIGEGLTVQATFQDFVSGPQTLTAGLMDIRIDGYFNADAEAVAFDDLRVTVIPEPNLYALCIGSALLLAQLFLSSGKHRRDPETGPTHKGPVTSFNKAHPRSHGSRS